MVGRISPSRQTPDIFFGSFYHFIPLFSTMFHVCVNMSRGDCVFFEQGAGTVAGLWAACVFMGKGFDGGQAFEKGILSFRRDGNTFL